VSFRYVINEHLISLLLTTTLDFPGPLGPKPNPNVTEKLYLNISE